MIIPERPPKSLLNKVAIRVYNHAYFRGSIPEEAAISYPVPGDLNGMPVVHFFHYWEKNVPEHMVTRPLTKIAVRVSLTIEDIEILEYKIASTGAVLFPEIEDPQPTPRQKLPSQSRKKLEEALYISCEEILRQYPKGSKSAQQVYLKALKYLELPGLLPFYRALNQSLISDIDLC